MGGLLLLLPMSVKQRQSKQGKTRKGQELDPINSLLIPHLHTLLLLMRKSPSLTMYLHGLTEKANQTVVWSDDKNIHKPICNWDN
jgi:hypothetical protein